MVNLQDYALARRVRDREMPSYTNPELREAKPQSRAMLLSFLRPSRIV
jgi:hypothetical protein